MLSGWWSKESTPMSDNQKAHIVMLNLGPPSHVVDIQNDEKYSRPDDRLPEQNSRWCSHQEWRIRYWKAVSPCCHQLKGFVKVDIIYSKTSPSGVRKSVRPRATKTKDRLRFLIVMLYMLEKYQMKWIHGSTFTYLFFKRFRVNCAACILVWEANCCDCTQKARNSGQKRTVGRFLISKMHVWVLTAPFYSEGQSGALERSTVCQSNTLSALPIPDIRKKPFCTVLLRMFSRAEILVLVFLCPPIQHHEALRRAHQTVPALSVGLPSKE